MSKFLSSKALLSKWSVVAFVLIAGLSISAISIAQTSPKMPQSTPGTDQASVSAEAPAADHPLIKPGDRACLRHTGSLIPPKKGDCLPVAGRSYGGNELRNTGAIDNAHALQMLDPSISLGH